MCEECHQNPCDPRCPNSPLGTPIATCFNCGEDLFEGDIYYPLLDLCEHCIKEYEVEVVKENPLDEEDGDDE